jgi:anti-sigma factor RsiW
MHRAHHLQDDRLFDVYIAERGGEPVDPPAAEHLADCEDCSARYAELTAFMNTLRATADAEADAVFTPERLRAQQQHIARRLEHIGRPARVISFPGRIVEHPINATQARTAPRWGAAAAAAGLFVGAALGAGYEWNALHAPRHAFAARNGVVSPAVSRTAPIGTRGTTPGDVASDDAFLSDLELALERPHTRELQAFDAFTPHVREVTNSR